jgi:membrane fusion protein, copper/silver efflux system
MTDQEEKQSLPPDVDPSRLHEGEEPVPPGVFAMSIVRWLLILSMAAVAGASLWHFFGHAGGEQRSVARQQFHCPMHPSVVQDQPGTCPICGMTLVPYDASPSTSASRPSPSEPIADPAHAGHRHQPSDPYACPMHPEETGTTPDATCPICKMKLMPRPPPAARAPGASGEGAQATVAAPKGLAPIDLSYARIQLVGMRTAQVVRGRLPSMLHAVGLIVAPEGGVASVQTLFSGWVEELLAAETGQPVIRGQLLARVYSPDLLAAQQELLNARRWSQPVQSDDRTATSNTLLENARQRLLLMGMQASQIAEVERSGVPHRLVEVRASARGYITQKTAVEGLYVQPGTQLFQIADLSRVWIMVDVFEHDAGRVRVGQAATVTLTAYPGEKFSGAVELVYPSLDAETRTLRARVALKNPGLKLRPGMFADVTMDVAQDEGLLIPREALVDTGEQQYVFVAQSEGRFTPRLVQVGARARDLVEVRAGLIEGETVVEAGNFLLDSESRLRATIEGQHTSTDASTPASTCDALFDRARFADKYAACRACEVQHRGMGSMEEDCRNAIPKPWR